MQKKIKVTVWLSKKGLKRIDRNARAVSMSRSAFLEHRGV